MPSSNTPGRDAMADVEMLALIIVAFGLAASYARLCGSLLPPADGSRRDRSMTIYGSLQILLFGLLIIASARPLGCYLERIFAGGRTAPSSAGTLPSCGGLLVGFDLGVILIVGGLTSLPAVVLGPVAEHLAMLAGTTF
jgi:hypothetical protein